jgi:DNA-binding MarR family transcriptional regulator
MVVIDNGSQGDERGPSAPAPAAADRAALVFDQLELLAVELVSVTNRAIGELGAGEVSFPQWRLLMVLGSAPGPLRLHEIARQVSASMPSASRLVDRMKRRGLVASAPDPGDRRGRLISLTERGAQMRDQVTARRRALIEEGLSSYEGAPDVVAELARIVEGLASRT